MRIFGIVISVVILINSAFAYQSLQEVYNAAGPNGQFDKYIELDPDIEYLGDLMIFNGMNVYIDGNGARIYGESTDLAIGVYSSNLEIMNCVIIGGYGGIYLSNLSSGKIYNNTIVRPVEAGVRCYYIDRTKVTEIYNNIIVDTDYGVFGIEDELPDYVAFNNLYNIEEIGYAQYCPT